MVGVPPNELARFYRFAHLVGSIDPSKPVDWGRIAHQSRFYDLSHFNKDFVEFTGHSPSDYLRLRRRFHVENPNHSLDVGPCQLIEFLQSSVLDFCTLKSKFK